MSCLTGTANPGSVQDWCIFFAVQYNITLKTLSFSLLKMQNRIVH